MESAQELEIRVKKRALHILERMDRTEHELREKLEKSDYPGEYIEKAIDYVKSYHYLDDYRYACTYIRYHQDRMSRTCLKMKLMQKGIDRELLSRVMEETYEGDESEQIRELLKKRKSKRTGDRRKDDHRDYQYLLRKGFQGHEIQKVMRENRMFEESCE